MEKQKKSSIFESMIDPRIKVILYDSDDSDKEMLYYDDLSRNQQVFVDAYYYFSRRAMKLKALSGLIKSFSRNYGKKNLEFEFMSEMFKIRIH